MRDSMTATAPCSVRKFSMRLVRCGQQAAAVLAGELARDRHLGERGGGDARERERRAGGGAEQEPGGAGEDRPGDREVREDEERDEQDRRERAEVVAEVARLVRARDVAGDGEGADEDEARSRHRWRCARWQGAASSMG